MVAPVNTMPAVQVAGPYAPIAALPVINITGTPGVGGNPPLDPVLARPVVVLSAGTIPLAPVQPIPMKSFTAGTVPQAPVTPIPVVIVG